MKVRGVSLAQWLIGVDCISYALCIAHSKGHWLSGSLLWDLKLTSKFLDAGHNFHAVMGANSRDPYYSPEQHRGSKNNVPFFF